MSKVRADEIFHEIRVKYKKSVLEYENRMNQFQYDNRDRIDMERAKWMLRTPSEKLRVINRNEELENLYSERKNMNMFKKPRKIDELGIFLGSLN